QEIGQKMQSGNFDPADIQKLMIDKGIIDQKMIDRMQTAMQSGMMSNIREQLGSTDDEWKVLLPKIRQGLRLSISIDHTGMCRASLMGFQSVSPVAKAMNDLRAAVKDPKTTNETLGVKLRNWRDVRDKAKTELAKAQKDLIDVLTPRQEATLFNMGFIQ